MVRVAVTTTAWVCYYLDCLWIWVQRVWWKKVEFHRSNGRKTHQAMQRMPVCLQLKGSPNRSFRDHLSSSHRESQKHERGQKCWSFGLKKKKKKKKPF